MTVSDRIRAAYARIEEVDRPEVWITLRPEEDVLADAKLLEERAAEGAELPLHGLLVAVKDNIDVAGLPTTAACPSYAYPAAASATAVGRLTDAGAIVLGKTNLDQFATGLVGIKPTVGLVPTKGVVPAARPYDCVSVFARTLTLAQRALAVLVHDGRAWPATTRLAAPPTPRVAVPTPDGLAVLPPGGRAAFEAAVGRLTGVEIVELDIAPLLAAATLLYGGALVAERYAAVGAFLDTGPADADPVVSSIIRAARDLPAHRLAADQATLARTRGAVEQALEGIDALLLPTTVGHPTLAEVAADPVGVNSRLGTYTNFVNLLDMAAVAVPAGAADGGLAGVTVVTRAFDDQVGFDIAARLTGEQHDRPLPPALDLVVFGAHLRGQPLNHQLTGRGGRYGGQVRTATAYRMVALPTQPPRPGIVRASIGGASLPGERWHLSAAALGEFLAELPAPMCLGRIELADGTSMIGFLCDGEAAALGGDITAYGGWLNYLAAD
jgi:allophanate hydrolase